MTTESKGGHTYDKLWCNDLAHAYKKIHIISQQRPHTFLCSLVNITTYRQPILHLRFGHSRTLYIFTSLSPDSKPLVFLQWQQNYPEFDGWGGPLVVKKRAVPGTSSVTVFVLMTANHNQNNIQQTDKDQLGENAASLTVGKMLKIDICRAK